MSEPTLKDLQDIARGAGVILREGYGREHNVRFKGVIDPVTEVDAASEEYILGEVNRRWAGHSIMAEESGLTSGSDGHMWYIDPLDGTVNYSHHIPIFSVSIAYAQDGMMTLGVVYDPMRDEMFSAERGKGASLNDRRLVVSTTHDLQKSLLVTGFPYDAWDTKHDNFSNYTRLGKMTQGVRRLGSAALDAAWVGAGRFDGFWEMTLKPWDVAAGGLIAEEAGARVTNIQNGPDYLAAPQSIVAAAPDIHPLILKVLEQH